MRFVTWVPLTNIVKFGSDVEMLLNDPRTVQPDVTIAAMADGSIAGCESVSEPDVTNIVLAIRIVTEDKGPKLPREFGQLVKQSHLRLIGDT